MTYPEALEYLFGLQRFGMRPGLDTTRRLAARVGNPEAGLRFLHVAGTNGKGSTCAFLEGACRAAGRRTGLYTSPHLVSFRERIQVDRLPIPEADVARWVARLREAVESDPGEERPTFFEFVTVLALGYFRERGCEVVVWETGMGGRLDATNIVTPLASVVTNVGLDHQAWLGNTVREIAGEKAGIVKPGVPAFTAAADPEVLAVLRRVAGERSTTLREVGADGPEVRTVRGLEPLPLAGEHQVLNAALALAVLEGVGGGLGVGRAEILEGLRTAHWPGRYQELEYRGRRVIVDGAHNPPAFEVLEVLLRERLGAAPWALVLGMLGDKDAGGALRTVVPGASRIVVVPVRSARAGDPGELEARCREAARPGVRVESADGVAAALERLPEGSTVLVTGSLYLVGEALALVAGDAANSEHGLNDWCRRG